MLTERQEKILYNLQLEFLDDLYEHITMQIGFYEKNIASVEAVYFECYGIILHHKSTDAGQQYKEQVTVAAAHNVKDQFESFAYKVQVDLLKHLVLDVTQRNGIAARYDEDNEPNSKIDYEKMKEHMKESLSCLSRNLHNLIISFSWIKNNDVIEGQIAKTISHFKLIRASK